MIATAIAGVPELVEPGVTGFMVPAGNVEKIADAVVKILTASTADLTALGTAGAARVAAMHDACKEAAKLKAYFAGAIGE